MKPLGKLFVKVMLQAGVLFGILMTLLTLVGGDEFKVGSILLSSVIFGAVLAFILIIWQQDRLKKMGVTEITEEVLKSHQQRTLPSRITKEELLKRLRKDVELGVNNLVEEENSLRFTSRMTQSSWGEKISIEFGPPEKGVRQITISSKPRIAVSLLDYGKNWENVVRIEKMITQKK